MTLAETEADDKWVRSQYVNTEKSRKHSHKPSSELQTHQYSYSKLDSEKNMETTAKQVKNFDNLIPLRNHYPVGAFETNSDAAGNLLRELEKLSENHSKRASNNIPPAEAVAPMQNEPLDSNINIRNSQMIKKHIPILKPSSSNNRCEPTREDQNIDECTKYSKDLQYDFKSN